MLRYRVVQVHTCAPTHLLKGLLGLAGTGVVGDWQCVYIFCHSETDVVGDWQCIYIFWHSETGVVGVCLHILVFRDRSRGSVFTYFGIQVRTALMGVVEISAKCGLHDVSNYASTPLAMHGWGLG